MATQSNQPDMWEIKCYQSIICDVSSGYCVLDLLLVFSPQVSHIKYLWMKTDLIKYSLSVHLEQSSVVENCWKTSLSETNRVWDNFLTLGNKSSFGCDWKCWITATLYVHYTHAHTLTYSKNKSGLVKKHRLHCLCLKYQPGSFTDDRLQSLGELALNEVIALFWTHSDKYLISVRLMQVDLMQACVLMP